VEEFQDDWSIVESEDDISDIYILTEILDAEEE